MKKVLFGLVAGFMLAGLLAVPASAAIDNTPDNDTVAIIKGGTFSESAVKTKAAQGDVPTVYAAFGIKQSQLNGFVDGIVYKDGRVTVGRDKVVARNAITAGRWNAPKAGMTKIDGTDRAYKMPTSYFVDEGQTAFIKMVNGRFAFAVIKPCGNPVSATPVNTDKPGMTVQKDAAPAGTSNWSQSASVMKGTNVRYRVTIKNTGNVTLSKLSMQDVFPMGMPQTAGYAVSINGGPASANLASGVALPELRPGGQHVIIYEATTSSVAVTADVCSNGLTNTVTVRTGDVLPDMSDTAVAKVCVPPVTPSVTTPAPPTPPTPQPPVVTASTPPAPVPAKLADTGPAAIFGIFASVMTAGAAAYRLVWLRFTV